MVRIGVDARVLLRPVCGIRVYLEQLLARVVQSDPSVELELFVDGDVGGIPPDIAALPRCRIHRYTLPLLTSRRPGSNWSAPFWLHLGIPFFIRNHSIDLFWGPNLLIPGPLCRVPQVVTVHDLAPYQPWDYQKPLWKIMFKSAFPVSLKSASVVIADSYATGSDLQHLFGIDSSKVQVVHLGLRDLEKAGGNREQTPYILAVGNITARKNYETLIRAFEKLRKQVSDIRLVICGKPGWGSENILELARSTPSASMIEIREHVNDAELSALYTNATVFAMPSLYEGFGLPVLEAMAFGVPVVSSNSSSLPELVGDAGILISPDEIDRWASELCRLVVDRAARKKLRDKGFRQVRLFSWDKTARMTLDAFNAALELRGKVRH